MSKHTHTHIYFRMKILNNMFFTLFFWEIWPYAIHKLIFFICRFLENKKQSWEFKRSFPKHILKPKKTKEKKRKFWFYIFFLFYLSFIYYFILSVGSGRLGLVEMAGLTRSSQLKKNRWKENTTETDQKWQKHENLKKFQSKWIKIVKTKKNRWMFCLLTKCNSQSRANFEQRNGCFFS